MSTIQIELKQHLEQNQKLRNAGASNEDIQTAALTYIAAALGNMDDTWSKLEILSGQLSTGDDSADD